MELQETENISRRATLDELGMKYGTDKVSLKHGYTDRYATYFESVRNSKIKILEIGIYGGASVKMWQEYFPKATIIGVDILPECEKYADERIKVEIGSQTDEFFLKQISEKHGPFNIIIDDGGHNWRQQVISFETLFPLLAPGGVYVIEDLHTSYWNGDGNAYFKSRGIENKFPDLNVTWGDYHISGVEYLKTLVDAVNLNGKSFTGYTELKPSELSYIENNIDFIHFYKSISFIKKKVIPIQ